MMYLIPQIQAPLSIRLIRYLQALIELLLVDANSRRDLREALVRVVALLVNHVHVVEVLQWSRQPRTCKVYYTRSLGRASLRNSPAMLMLLDNSKHEDESYQKIQRTPDWSNSALLNG